MRTSDGSRTASRPSAQTTAASTPRSSVHDRRGNEWESLSLFLSRTRSCDLFFSLHILKSLSFPFHKSSFRLSLSPCHLLFLGPSSSPLRASAAIPIVFPKRDGHPKLSSHKSLPSEDLRPLTTSASSPSMAPLCHSLSSPCLFHIHTLFFFLSSSLSLSLFLFLSEKRRKNAPQLLFT